MAIHDTLILGELSLLEKSQPITEFANSTLYDVIQDMKDSMHHKNGIGLAAPQIGVNQRIIIFGFEGSPRYPNQKPVPFTVLINPEYEILSNETSFIWEGCLSVPGLRGNIRRFEKLRYWGYSPEGQRIEGIAEGFHARMIQHESDHLDGILFPFRIEKPEDLGFESVILPRVFGKPSKDSNGK